jgi:hypothetical protein
MMSRLQFDCTIQHDGGIPYTLDRTRNADSAISLQPGDCDYKGLTASSLLVGHILFLQQTATTTSCKYNFFLINFD